MMKKVILIFCLFVHPSVFSHLIKFENKGKHKTTVFYKLAQIIRGGNYPSYKLNVTNENINSVTISGNQIIEKQIDDLGGNFKFKKSQPSIVIPMVTKIVYHTNKNHNESKKISVNDTGSMLSKGDHNEKIIWANNGSDSHFVHIGAAFLEISPINNKKPFDIWLSINKGKTWRRIT